MILLFTKRLQKDYAFREAGERQPASGQIWLRQKDLLPIRITLNTEERTSKKFTIRTDATVDYSPSQFGLALEHVIHRQFLNSALMVENDLHYADFHHANAMIP